MRRILAVLGLVAVGVSGCSSAPALRAEVRGGPSDYSPHVPRSSFVATVTNPWFPLTPGARWVYRTTTADGTEENEVVVTDRRRRILGIDAVVVHDMVRVDGKVTEDTYDWYAQNRDGTVWYLGEDTKAYEDGKVSTAGSWETGVDGARPGVAMQAHPRPGRWYWQELREGKAEDQARVVSLDGTATVPAGTFRHLVVTEERSPLEPSIIERKYYARGIGVVYERTTKGPTETSVLVRQVPPA